MRDPIEVALGHVERVRAERRAKWERIKRSHPGLAQLLTDCKARFGEIKLDYFEETKP